MRQSKKESSPAKKSRSESKKESSPAKKSRSKSKKESSIAKKSHSEQNESQTRKKKNSSPSDADDTNINKRAKSSLTQPDKNIINSYFAAFSASAVISSAFVSDCMKKCYRYHKENNNFYYSLIELVNKSEQKPEDIQISLPGKQIVVARSQSSPPKGMEVCSINQEKPRKNEEKRTNSSDWELIKYLQSWLNADQLREIKEEVAKKGYWSVPETLLNQNPGLRLCDGVKLKPEDIPNAQTCNRAKEFFGQSPEMLEIFCSLKIQELISHKKNKRLQAPATQINLSIITQADVMVAVINANLKFDSSNCFAVTLIDPTNDKVASICDALDKASWLKDQASKTQIRFADRLIEKDVVFRHFLDEKISYGLLPQEIERRISTKSSEVNFWEGVAYERKRKELIDYATALDAMDNALFTEEQRYKDNPLKPSVERLAAFRDGIQQKKHLGKVIQNQKLGRGTLLHLPTGYGKTFVMFMAMAQHREALRQAGKAIKPYLIVVKANNVAQSWEDNLDSLNTTMRDQATHNIFDITEGNSLELLNFADENKSSWPYLKQKTVQKAFLEFCSSPEALANKKLKPVAVAINSISLQNAVNLIFHPNLLHIRDGKDHHPEADFFILFKLSGVVSRKGYVIKDKTYWEEQLTNLINSVNENFQKINEYLEVPNESSESVIVSIRRFLRLDSRTFSAGSSYKKIMEISENDQSYHALLQKHKKLCDLLKKLFGHTDFIDQLRDLHFLLAFFKQAQSQFDAVNKKNKIDLDKLLKFKAPVGGKERTALQLLSYYKEKQAEAMHKYRALVDRFGGVIVDESEQVLSLASHNQVGTGSVSATHILLDMAMTYQRASQLGSASNRLIIAASATPFPNEMNEYFLHMELLLAKAMNQHDSLYCGLKRKWSSFELAIDSKMNEEEVQPYKKAIAEKDFIESIFQKWIRMLYRAAVSYEAPQKEITNQTEEEIVLVKCDKTIVNYVPKKKAETLNLITQFYAGILRTTSFVSIDEKSSIFRKLSLSEKNAFYADTHEQATLLAMRLTDYFESQGTNRDAIQIGLFYEENFVRKQYPTNTTYKAYENVTFNVDRTCNRRAFNNIVSIDDFFSHLNQVLSSTSTDSVPHLNWKTVLAKTGLIGEIQARKSDEDLLKQLKKESQKFFPSPKNHDNWLSLSTTDRERKMRRFIDFLRLVIQLERYSKENLIRDFAAELGKSFRSYLPKRFHQESDIRRAFSRFKESYTADFKDLNSSKKPGKENGPWANNPFKNFIHLFLHYLTKVLQFNIFIFGEAGTSGMRIDADRLIILSGAWTEGRLTQVKGRVGRAKGSENRRCIIYSPLSNTLFEYLILRYYVKKGAYDRFIRSSYPLPFTDIAGPLVLACEIDRYYWQKFNSEDPQTYIDASVHTKVEGFISKDPAYLELGAYEKANRIIPSDAKQAWQEFRDNEVVQSPRASMTDPVTLLGQPQDRSDPGVDLPGIVDSWGEEFSRYIEMYALTKGFVRNKKNEGVAGSMLRCLVDEGTFTLYTVWEPTQKLVDANPTLLMLKYKPKTSGKQRIKSEFSRFIPYNPSLSEGVVVINTTGVERSLRSEKPFYTETMSVGGKSVDIQYKANVLAVEWPKDMPDDLYIELSVDPTNPVSQINIEPLRLRGHEYELFGEIVGGHHETSTHWWTYRRNGDGFYLIDDLKERIDSIPENAHPGHGESRIFRFVKRQKMAELQSLKPKRLINRNANCFINAAFQLADSDELRTAVLAFKQSVDCLPNFPINQLEKLYGQTNQTIPPSPPKIRPLDLSKDNVTQDLKNFVDTAKRQVILILPTRGRGTQKTVNPDSCIDGDISIEKWMHEHRKLVKGHFGGYQFIVILGLNREFDDDEQLPKIRKEIKEMQQSVLQADNQGALHIIPAPFAWQTKDRLDGKVPLGQMRNYCLEKASFVYDYVISTDCCGQQSEKVTLMSMDGDTRLNFESLKHLLEPSYTCYRLTVKTGGYEMWHAPHSLMSIYQNNQNPLKVDDFSADQWSIYWRTLVSHLSMEMSARLTESTKKLVGFSCQPRYCHFGYFSEPTIFVSPELTSKLFNHRQKCREEDPEYSFFTASTKQKAPFGFWDNEGRSFRRFLSDMIDTKDPIKIDSLGPSRCQKGKQRPLLFNHERFAIPAPSHRKLKQELSQEELSWVISNMHSQPQHLIKPWLAGSNIATFLTRPLFLVRGFACYFYANNFLKLLNLGPGRSRLLSYYLLKRYRNPGHKPESEMLKEFSCSKDDFETFVNLNFFSYQEERAQDKDNLEFRKYAAMLAHWAYVVSEVLRDWFTETYQGEKIHGNRYKPMTFPDTYPSKAVQAVEQEAATTQSTAERVEVLATTQSTAEPVEVLGRLLSYFEKKSGGDYQLFSDATEYVRRLTQYVMFLALVSYKGDLILFMNRNSAATEQEEMDNALDCANGLRSSQPIAIGIVIDTSQPRVAINFRHRYRGRTTNQDLEKIGTDLFSSDELERIAVPVPDLSPDGAERVRPSV